MLITDLDGFIGSGVEGFYYRQTRFLSKMRFAVDGIAPLAVSANPVDSYSSIAYYLAASPAGKEAGPQPDNGEKGGGEMVRHGIEVQINRFVGGGLHHDLYVTNHALAPATVVMCWELDADFADRSEAEAGRAPAKRARRAPVEIARGLRRTRFPLPSSAAPPRYRGLLFRGWRFDREGWRRLLDTEPAAASSR